MTKEFFAASLAIAMSLPAVARAGEFSAMDADGDGYVTMSEFQQAMPEATAEIFTAADANADGALTDEEVAAAQDAGVLPAKEG
ncbi:EF-hand domain-containing protein [Roseovarius sp.]|uniref:EF-hand domain-containing protein n=1 Tax=Roseovarius sp. TaxID=1486281 RepID=UPI003A97649B